MGKKKKYIVVILNLMFCLLLLSHNTKADKTKQALKYLERGELNRVEEILIKSLEKEPFNPASKYLYALLYSTEDFYNYNLDSARTYILESLMEFDSLTERQTTELEDLGITSNDLKERKQIIQTLTFQVHIKANSIEQFNLFMEQNKDASQFPHAVKKRDSLAYLLAKEENTWKGYKQYMEDYPESIDFGKAKSRYDDLIFRSKTQSGKLFDLQKFIEEHPNSPYKNDIQEEVFSIVAADADKESIFNIIDEYKNDQLTRKAINVLYHLDEDARKRVMEHESTLYLPVQDSILEASKFDFEVLFPVLEDDKYLFINFSGDQIIKKGFDEIAAKYYCGNIVDDILDVTDNGVHQIINRQGQAIFEKSFDEVEDVGIGVLKVKTNEKYKAIHKSGFEVSDQQYDDISVIGDRLIKVKKGNKYGLIGITGRMICPLIYDDIYTIQDFWIFENAEKIGLLSFEDIIRGVHGEELDPILKYEEAELIDDKYLICFTEDKEVLFNADLRRVVPEGEQRINTRFETWTTKQPFGYRVFNREVGELTHTLYNDLLQNDEWLALKKNRKWSVYRKGLNDTPIIGLDSVKLIGENIAMVFRDLSGTAIFPNKRTVEFSTGDLLYSIGDNKDTDSHYLVINKNGDNALYKDGELLFTADYDEVGYISDSAFYVKEGNKYGAVGVDGRLIMRVRYDAIIKAENDIAPVLYRGKFGAYNFNDRILLKLDYDQKLRAYNDDLLIVKLEGKEGLLNKYNEDVVLPSYDLIKYWTDSTALVKVSSEWSFVDIYSGEEVFGGILDYKVLSKNKNETVLRIRTANGYGIYDTSEGLRIKATFSDIININTLEEPLYFCEKSIPEGDYYIAIYKDKTGKTIRSQAYRAEEYERIVCE